MSEKSSREALSEPERRPLGDGLEGVVDANGELKLLCWDGEKVLRVHLSASEAVRLAGLLGDHDEMLSSNAGNLKPVDQLMGEGRPGQHFSIQSYQLGYGSEIPVNRSGLEDLGPPTDPGRPLLA